jgi:hypothetical protein
MFQTISIDDDAARAGVNEVVRTCAKPGCDCGSETFGGSSDPRRSNRVAAEAFCMEGFDFLSCRQDFPMLAIFPI